MRILIANDDGYLAPGLAALVRACEGLGDIKVIAPEQNASGTSNSLSLHRPLSVHRAYNGFYVVNGTPSDCVHLALTAPLFEGWRPQLVLSGINNGANLGDDTIYSGTVAAATEAYLFDIPAVAFSQADRDWHELDAAGLTVRSLLDELLAQPLGPAFLLNVNIPNRPDAPSLPRVLTRLGRRHANAASFAQRNPRGDLVYWIGPPGEARLEDEGTDFQAVAQGKVSITPLQVDLTHHAALPEWTRRLQRGGA
ncbi:5'/3'-nucleotidase SurE [Inhella sp.]|uniref:5'/3'-nucleotidase SurE n=1 Tax=Inhella sp. TaxID=1921806 RepID=UPI0035B3E7E9